MIGLKFLFLLLISPPADTTINGVKVQFDYSLSIFPTSWQTVPISARGETMPVAEIPRTRMVMKTTLNKYPAAVLKDNLAGVYFVRTMKFYDVSYGGTNSSDAVYICNDGLSLGYTDYYIEQTFHHEFSSILFRNHTSFLDTTEWKRANISTFEYNDPENGVGSIRNNQSSQDIDTVLTQQGFLTQYSLSSMENDINTFAQNLLCSTADFWRITDKYPRINKKVKLLIAFYHNIDPSFTEEYFRKLKPGK